jgi:four helix bundle protein
VNQEQMKDRTKAFALRVIKLTEMLGWSGPLGVIAKQLSKCGTSVGANYRAACRAKSPADFVSKLGTVEEEADESAYWMELLIAGEYVKASQLEPLLGEANELLAIIVASIKTARGER